MDQSIVNNEFVAIVDRQVQSAINAEDYQCEPGGLGFFVQDILNSLTDDEYTLFVMLYTKVGLQDWFMYAHFLIRTDDSNDEFYPSQEQGDKFRHRLDEMEGFWDVYSEDIALHSLTPHLLKDTDLMIRTLGMGWGLDPEVATDGIDTVLEIFDKYPRIGYMFPMWSLNAFAYSDAPGTYPRRLKTYAKGYSSNLVISFPRTRWEWNSHGRWSYSIFWHSWPRGYWTGLCFKP